ncbi:hypothetical protein [Bombella pollinis]|uniref:Uncharacterized protein n=1 Tax=Bombella pollinis TaxID=2967337 RepID=A0ABT3WMC3_9PROT|nr:hypothetical protein [Bombella pollinis]MCX5619429.1 hypothetical protein [Bombella pollinis]
MMQHSSPFFERVWFLDCFGHIISYAPSQGRLIRTPFQGTLTNGFVPSPFPIPLEAELTWWTLYGEQLPIEPLIMKKIRRGLVKLQKKGAQEFLSINPRSDDLGFVNDVNAWEQFLPVTEQILQGLSLISDPDMSTICEATSAQHVGHFSFLPPSENKPGCGRIGDHIINIYNNLSSLSALSSIQEGEMRTISLTNDEDNAISHFTLSCRSVKP